MDCIDPEELSPVARDHATHPRNCGPLKAFDGHARITGPCGDTMEFWLIAQHDMVSRISFITDGCCTSLACGSVATILAQGKRIADAAALRQEDILDALGAFPAQFEHCALLAANTLQAACEDYLKHREGTSMDSSNAQTNCETCENENCSASSHGNKKAMAEAEDQRILHERLSRIRRKIVVLSGKGGVGKSTVAINLATALMMSGKRVGLLDVDIHGPSIPTMLGLEHATPMGHEEGILPIELDDMKVMSLGFLLQSQDDAVIWRGPMKMKVIQQFLTDVIWGDLDYLIIDSPPGTGDEPLSVCQLIGTMDGAVIVTTPQKVAAVDVRKSITFCRQLQVPVIGVVENMSGFVCPKCGEVTQILPSGGGKSITEDMSVPFLGSIPMDPQIAETCDSGQTYIRRYSTTPTAEIMRNILVPILALDETKVIEKTSETTPHEKGQHMKIAIPLADGKLTMHFGHCERFALMNVDTAQKKIVKREDIDAPPHQPGLLPSWLAERGATMIIAGGMGQRAQDLFTQHGIHVVVGAPSDTPESLVGDYLAGTLQAGENVCDH